MSTWSSPQSASEMRPGPTSSPASRRMRPNVTTWRTSPPSGACGSNRPRLLDECDEGLVANRGKVLVVLQHGAERLLDGRRVELLPTERRECVRPVDRLGDAGRLGEIERPQALHEGSGLRGEAIGDSRNPQRHDLDLPLERRVTDPVEETSALERVVELTRAIRGEDDGRAASRSNRPDLRNRDLEVGQDLEQERLELVVGAVDLVDQQDDGVGALDRLEQRPADQEVRAEQLLLGDRPLLRGADVEELPWVVRRVKWVA